MHIILTKFPGIGPWVGAYMPNPTAELLHDWLASLRRIERCRGTRNTFMSIDIGDGILRQVFAAASDPLYAQPVKLHYGMAYGEPCNSIEQCGRMMDWISQTLADEATRNREGSPPHYRTWANADADGWVTWPRSQEYRGHYILLGYESDRLRVRLRERSAMRTNDNTTRFRWLHPPKTIETQPVIIDQQLNKIGRRHSGNKLVRRSDYLRLIEACRREIDAAVDGTADIDLIE